MENTLNDYSLLNMALVGPVAGITNNFYDLAQEPISGNLYASATDFFSTGSVSIFDNANNLVDQFAVGISPGTIVFDVRASVGLTEINTTIGVYPNPSNGVFQIVGLTAGDTYQITNATGQVIFEGQTNTIDMRHFDAGVYLIQTQKGQARVLKY
jgi:hypothetical protein